MKRVWKKLLPPVFAVLLIAPTAFFAYPNKSDAFLGCLGGALFNSLIGGVQAIGDAVRKIAVSDSTVAQNTNKTSSNTKGSLLKECILDVTAKNIARAVLQSFTKSVVNWINTGFRGEPSFVTNPTGFLMDVADREFGREIRKIAPILCSPFRLNLQFALGLQYSLNTKEEVGCRLSDVIANARGSYDSFVSGDFRSGGWRNWVNITHTPQNNVYGAYLGTVSRLDASIVSATGEEIKLLDFGQGFKSWRSCEEWGPDEKDKNGKVLRRGKCIKEGKIKTPGSIIVNSTSDTLKSSLEELAVADEIDEIFGALVNQLLIRTLGPGGLLGNSDPEPGGGLSYLDQLVNSPENAERLASIRPPEGINCNREYEASGDPSYPFQVMEVSYRRTNGKITKVEEVAATATMPRIQKLTIELLEGPATGTEVVVEHVVKMNTDALAVSNTPISFDRFPDSYVGVQTIRLPRPATKPDGTPLLRDPGIHPQWSDYFAQVRQGCRNQINLYAERNNQDVIDRAGAPTAPPLGTPPPLSAPQTQTFEGNIARGKASQQSSTVVDSKSDISYPAGNGNDGSPQTTAISDSDFNWWEVDLGSNSFGISQSATEIKEIREIVVTQRLRAPSQSQSIDALLSDEPFVTPAHAKTREEIMGQIASPCGTTQTLTARIRCYPIPDTPGAGQPAHIVRVSVGVGPGDILPGEKGRYLRILKREHQGRLSLGDVDVQGKTMQTISTGSGGTTPPPDVPLQVGFNPTSLTVQKCQLSVCNNFTRGETLTLPPDLAIEFRANKKLEGVSLQARLKVYPGAVAVAWKQYFNADPVTKKGFKFVGGNDITSFGAPSTPPFITIESDGDQVINPVICDNAAVPTVPCTTNLVGTKEQNVAEPIVFAKGLTVTPEQPIKIGFQDALLAKDGVVGGSTVRILIEAVYKENAAGPDKKLPFPLDFVIN